MRGRKPKPVEQKLREGNPGQRRLPEPLRFGEPGSLEPPALLPPEGRELWNEFVPLLAQQRIVDVVDRAALTVLCLQWARCCQAAAVLAEQGLFVLGSTGQPVEHPALAIERQADALLLRYCEQYGLTAAARARIAAGTRVARSDAEEELRSIICMEPIEIDVDQS